MKVYDIYVAGERVTGGVMADDEFEKLLSAMKKDYKIIETRRGLRMFKANDGTLIFLVFDEAATATDTANDVIERVRTWLR